MSDEDCCAEDPKMSLGFSKGFGKPGLMKVPTLQADDTNYLQLA